MEMEKKKRLGTGRVAFLARKDEIKARIEAGYTMVAVYEEHQKELGISYGQFVNYVNKYIKDKQHGNVGSATEKGKDAKEKRPIREPGQPAFISSDTPRDRDSLIGRKK